MNETLMRTAGRMQEAGNLVEAARLYGVVLESDPRNFQALYRLGLLHFGSGRFDTAERLFGEAARADPKSADAHFARGCALYRLNRREDAVRAFETALVLNPRHSDALVNRGVALLELGRHDDAAESFAEALAVGPARAPLWLAHGNALAAGGRLKDALASYEKALALKRDLAEAWNNRGTALVTLGRYEEAVASYDTLLALHPRDATALINRGIALARISRHKEALASFDAALAADPKRPDTLYHRGTALLALQRYREALAVFDACIAASPGNADAFVSRGVALRSLGLLDKALASYDAALAAHPKSIEALANRGSILFDLKRYEEAVRDYERAISIDPDVRYGLGHLAYYRLRNCDWCGIAEARAEIAARLRRGKQVVQPFMNLVLSESPVDQLECARIWARHEYPPPAQIRTPRRHGRRERLNIAYVSADFRLHAVAALIAGVFEHHDRDRFKISAISFGPDDGSAMRARMIRAFEDFEDVRDKTDDEIAELVRRANVDIAVDLMGYSGGCRPGIFAYRPAPIQAQYLGYPGTMGALEMDYILADRIVIPEDHRAYYGERAVYLPDSYQCNDSARVISEHTPLRAEAGLPEKGFVFCCFNASHKLTPEIFGVWMRLLDAVEGSVLWLLEPHAAASRNLRSEAENRGIAPERLIFAPFAQTAEHLARHRLADLFLDTLPYGAHTTASDALWAGLPVVTCLGETFAGRVGASLVTAAGLPELVAHSLDEYEALALKLARDADALSAVKAKLAANHGSCALFDTARFTRHLEAAYREMWARHERGEAPQSFTVAAET